MNRNTRAPRPWTTAVLAGMASYLDAAVLITTGIALVLYRPSLGIDDLQFGLLSSLLTLCFAFGALFGGRLGDRFGRRIVYTTTLVALVVAMGVMAFAVNVPMLMIGVIIAGLSIGADLPVSLAMLAEEAPEGKRGKFVAFSAILWIVGISVSNGLSALLGGLGDLGGRLMFAHIGLVALVVLLLRASSSESQEWVRARAANAAAAASPNQERIDLGSLKRLLHPPFVFALLATGVFYASWTIASNTVGQFSALLFVELGGTTVQTFGLIKLVNIPLGLLTGFLFMRIVDTRFRYTWFVLGAVIQASAFTVPMVFGGQLWSLMYMAYAFSVGAALAGEALYKVWSQELYPTLLRTTAQGSTIAFARIIAAGAAIFIPTLAASDPSALFTVLTCCVVFSSLIGFFWIRRLPKATADNAIDTEAEETASAATR